MNRKGPITWPALERHRGPALTALLAALLAVLVAGSAAMAQTSASFNLEWHVVGGGGQPISSAHYLVNSTAGQAAASPPFSVSSHYAVSGGYWFEGIFMDESVHLPLVLRNYP